jgi:hypothetical protein
MVGELSMPACFRANDKEQERDAADGWREPPGYLGEAVRRAKQIPSRTGQNKPPGKAAG